MDSARNLELRGRGDLALIAQQEEARRAAMEAVRLAVPHGDHVHCYSFGADGPQPPEIKLRCGVCNRAMRELTLDHSGNACVIGGLTAEGRSGELKPGAGRMTSTKRRRAADCFDASPGGWSAGAGREPSHYRFVCRHKAGLEPVLRRVSTADLLTAYLDAVCAGRRSIELT